MKNISHFLNFKSASASAVQWITFITKKLNANPIFCNTSSKRNSTERKLSFVLESDISEDYSKQDETAFLPENLQEIIPSKLSYPIFNVEDVFESDNLLNELLDTELVLISCNEIDENGLLLDELSAKILNKLKCPVILLPANVNAPKNIDHIVYTTDIRFTELRFVRQFASITRTFESALTIGHVSESGIPDLDIDYGKNLFDDCFARKISNFPLTMENIKRLDIQKYPDLVHEYLTGDIYAMINKNLNLKEGDYINSPAIKLAGLAKKPILLINNK